MTSFDLQLTDLERRLMNFSRRHSTLGIIGLVTLVSVLGSLVIIMGLVYPFADTDVSNDGFWYFLGGAIGVPLIIAPLASALFARLLVLLDKSFQVVESLSTTDPLTGSANRRGFFALAKQNIQTLHDASVCAVGMVDLNRFKTLNDTHGHQAGDTALVTIAQDLQRIIGESGTVGRIGGDEFALLILAKPARLQSIEAAIEKHCSHFAIALSSGSEAALSASVGIVQIGHGERFEDALSRADAVLYAKKAAAHGRRDSVTRQASRALAQNTQTKGETEAAWSKSEASHS